MQVWITQFENGKIFYFRKVSVWENGLLERLTNVRYADDVIMFAKKFSGMPIDVGNFCGGTT